MTFHDAVRRRRMVRNYTDEPVEPAVLDRVLAAAFRAPSAGNTQALDLVVVADPSRYWAVTLPDPAGFRWAGLLRAPLLVVPVVDPGAYPAHYAEADKVATGLGDGVDAWPVPYWWVDAGMAVEALLLACVAEGLGACFFGQFGHEPAVLAMLGVPEGRRAVGTVALGHPAPDEPGRSASRPRRTDRIHRARW